MSYSVILLVLAAAFFHATWNIIVKGGSHKLFETSFNALGGGLGALCLLPFVPLPPVECWGLLGLSVLFHLLYSASMAATYKVADLTLAYSIMRGTAPILTALALVAAGDSLTLYGWTGIILLCGGILTLTLQQKNKGSLRGVLLALRTSLAIMAYTIADGFGARAAGDSLTYTCWLFVFNIFPLNVYCLVRYGEEFKRYAAQRVKIGIAGGLCGLASYGIAIWAMTVAPIALVAALRETSVIFGMIMAVMFLGERLTLARSCAVILVMAGAMCARLG